MDGDNVTLTAGDDIINQGADMAAGSQLTLT